MKAPRRDGRWRARFKRFLERAAVRSGVVGAAERAHRHEAAILSYHNVVPHGEPPCGDRSLHVSEKRFREHLNMLAGRYELVSIEEIGMRVGDAAAGGSAPRVAITFDDAYAGAIAVALPLLAERGVSATVFVSPGLLEGRAFWWDRLADPASGRVAPEVRDHALWKLGGDAEAVVRWAAEAGLETASLPEYARSTAWERLQGGVTERVLIGAHGWEHRNFAALDDASLVTELERPHVWLAERLKAYRPWVAYPYGLTSDGVARAASRIYELGLRVDGGLAPVAWPRSRPYDVPRINVPAGLSADGLRLRIGGVIGGRATP